MASPIFLSKPSESFSVWVILRGMQFALLSAYRFLQNPQLMRSDYILMMSAQMIKLQVILYMTTNIPLYLISKYYGLNSQFIFLVKFLINPNIFLLTFTSFFQHTFDDAFLFNLHFIDKKTGVHFYENLKVIENEEIMKDKSHVFWLFPLFPQFKRHMQTSPRFNSFLKRYSLVTLYNLFMFAMITVPNRFTSVFLSFSSFQTFHHKLGSVPCVLLVASLSVMPYNYTALILTTFYSCSNLSEDFLLPYIHRINPTKLELNHWLNSRSGALFGFSLVHFFLINYFPSLSVLFYVLGLSNMAYLLTKVSNSPPPANLSKPQLINWFSLQLIWTGHFEFSNGEWLNDPFQAIPGSFVFE